VIGDAQFADGELGIQGRPWTAENEVSELAEIDIGIMPLPNDEWAKGKCGLKGLTYMSLGIPAVMSPVGVNSEIIQDGVNGFLADTQEEWLEKLSLLVENAGLRRSIGAKAAETVRDRYSVIAWRDKYVELLDRLAKGK
jgi:glycosyltransferase involved in cell wall biosynthesis